jgi:hypothetical protein
MEAGGEDKGRYYHEAAGEEEKTMDKVRCRRSSIIAR